jgi:hypothetical protein
LQENGANYPPNCESYVRFINTYLNCWFYSSVTVARRQTKRFARVRSDICAMSAGRRKRVAPMVVSIYFTANWCTNAFVFIGRNHTHVKEEPASPAKKRKAYSMSGSNPIRTLELFNEADSPQGSSKRQKTGTTHVRFDSTAASSGTRPPPQGRPENRHGLPRPTKRLKAT